MKKLMLYVPLAGLLITAVVQYRVLWAVLCYTFYVPVWLLLLYHVVLVLASILYLVAYRQRHNSFKIGEVVHYNLIHRKVAIVGTVLHVSNTFKVRLPDSSIVIAHASALSRLQ
jgi:hypothetical protein